MNEENFENIKPDSVIDKLKNKFDNFLNDNITDETLYNKLLSIDNSLKIIAGIDQKISKENFEIDIIKTIDSISGYSASDTLIKYLPDHYISIEYIMLQAVGNMVGISIYQDQNNKFLPISAPSGEIIELHPPIKFIEEKDLMISYVTLPITMGLSAILNIFIKAKYNRNYIDVR